MKEAQSINKTTMRYCIMTVAIFVGSLFCLPLAHALPSEEAKFFYEEASGPTDEELSSGVQFIRYIYKTALSRSGHGMDAAEKQIVFKELLRLGMKGDIHVLAMTAVLPHVDSEFSEGIDVSLIEPWLIRHLGEAEAHWLLGVFYLHWLSGSPPMSYAPVYVNAPKHFRKSALAGNRKSMMFISAYSSKGDDFTPLPGQEIKNPMPDYIAKGEREKWYWVVRAAELGDAWANYFAGLQYAEERPGRPIEEASRMTVYYWDRSARRGDSTTCAWLALLFEDGEEYGLETALNIEQDCKKSMFYGMLRTRLRTQGEYITDRKVSNDGADAEFFAQKFLNGLPRKNFPPCLTRFQYKAVLKESKIAYDEFKARQAEEKAAQQALYDKARKALPELRAELEAVGVKVGDGQ